MLLGAFLRFFDLDKNPNGFYVDEAAIGFNAYSLAETGKDEYGKDFPIFLRSYGVYASPLYTYITALVTKLFGLSIFSTRLLSAVSGVLSIPLIYLIFKNLSIFKNKHIPLMGALLFAISPWSIFFSRGAFEANLGLFLTLVAVYFFLLSKEKTNYIIFSFLFLGLSTYAYQSNRLTSLLFIVGFTTLIYLRKFQELFKNRYLLIAVFIFLIIEIPQIFLLNTPAFNARQTNLFYSQAIQMQVKEDFDYLPHPISFSVVFLREFSSRFVSYLSPRNLFFYPDSDLQRSFPELSLFYPWLVVPYFVGFYMLFKRLRKRNIQFLLILLFSALIPASLTGDPFSTLRSLVAILPVLVIISLGLEEILYNKLFRINTPILIFLCLFSLIYLYRSQGVLFPNERGKVWGYGYSKLAEEIKNRPSYKFLLALDKPSYIELAFFLKIHPRIFQESVDKNVKHNYYTNAKWDNHYKFSNIEIRDLDWLKDPCSDQIIVGDELLISLKQATEHNLIKVFEIRSPIEERLFFGYKTDPKNACI